MTDTGSDLCVPRVVHYLDIYRTPLGNSAPYTKQPIPPAIMARFISTLESLCATNHIRFGTLRATRKTTLDGRPARIYASRIEIYPMSPEELAGNLAQ